VSFISPFRSERRMARDMLQPGEFIEIFVDTPIDVCITRDPKGLYLKARHGEIKHFTGIDSPYEDPDTAEIRVKTVGSDPADLAARIVDYLRESGVIP
jgi:bifunctional enzyme CysN/CysC